MIKLPASYIEKAYEKCIKNDMASSGVHALKLQTNGAEKVLATLIMS